MARQVCSKRGLFAAGAATCGRAAPTTLRLAEKTYSDEMLASPGAKRCLPAFLNRLVSCRPMANAVIQLEQVQKAFRTPAGERVPILDVERFEVAAGEQVALEGHSGSGKTTLLNVIAGIMRPDTGSVILDGIDLAKLPEASRDRVRADRLGLVFQQFNLLPGFTAIENVLVAMAFSSHRPDRGRAEALLASVGLAHRLSHKPAALSVGEQQRVAVARALANKPRVILADEPTASIDPGHQQQVVDLLKRTCQDENVALVVVTHTPEVAAQFARRVRIESFNRVLQRMAKPDAAAVSDGGEA
jgi:ABC-type lipoprotein export system ATPase subunit